MVNKGTKMFKLVLVVILTVSFTVSLVSCDIYEEKIQFVVYNDGKSQISTFNESISEQGCNLEGNFSFVTHGWLGSNSPWIPDLISNLSYQRNGCIIFMNYSYFGDRENYFEVVSFFRPISELVTRKLKQLRDEGASSDKMFMFGFSLGGRIVIEAAIDFGKRLINQIDSKVNFLKGSFDNLE